MRSTKVKDREEEEEEDYCAEEEGDPGRDSSVENWML